VEDIRNLHLDCSLWTIYSVSIAIVYCHSALRAEKNGSWEAETDDVDSSSCEVTRNPTNSAD
jgi:hypothetical protein